MKKNSMKLKSFGSVADKHVGFALLAFVGLVLLVQPTLHWQYLSMYFLLATALAVYAYLRASLLPGIGAVIVLIGVLAADAPLRCVGGGCSAPER